MPSVDLVLVLDRSGSMMGELNAVRGFATSIVDQLDLSANTSSTVSIIDFSSTARALLTTSSDRTAIDTAINEDYGPALGETSISSGLSVGRDALMALNSSTSSGGRVLMLLTDGEQTTYFGGAEAAIDAATAVKADGITIFAIGFGDATASTLDAIATPPASQHSYLEQTSWTSHNTLRASAIYWRAHRPLHHHRLTCHRHRTHRRHRRRRGYRRHPCLLRPRHRHPCLLRPRRRPRRRQRAQPSPRARTSPAIAAPCRRSDARMLQPNPLASLASGITVATSAAACTVQLRGLCRRAGGHRPLPRGPHLLHVRHSLNSPSIRLLHDMLVRSGMHRLRRPF